MRSDYIKIEQSHFLSQFTVQFPHWEGPARTRQPFARWGTGGYTPLEWYRAYNDVKHDRAEQLAKATFLQLTDAWCALCVLLTAQFLFEDFSPGHDTLAIEGYGSVFDDAYEPAIGSFLGVSLPDFVPAAERYEFAWKDLSGMDRPFAKFNYDKVE